ncbi:MAG: DUF5996 family protein [Sphingomonas sp.]|nr:DUF5996 family protein [Sphingomonas sp.]
MSDNWPRLEPDRDSSTFAYLHLASQMLGKLRVAHAPWVNHGWHVTLLPVAEGLAMPPLASGGLRFELVMDLCSHVISLRTSSGVTDSVPLGGGTIAGLHRSLVAMLDRHGLVSSFHGLPNEIPGALAFASDETDRPYRRESAEALRDALAAMVPVFERFRAGFLGKASPVHFFWGSFDLAVTRFSGRAAPLHPGGVPGLPDAVTQEAYSHEVSSFSGHAAPAHPGGIPGLPDRITREAYSHEVSSAGFWPGGVTAAEPIFYSYAYPEPDGFRTARIAPSSSGFDAQLGEFVLPYDEVRRSSRPEEELTTFLQSTYDAAANLGGWDRGALEREPVAP